MSEFYDRMNKREIEQRAARVMANRPENLHDYQGCKPSDAIGVGLCGPEPPVQPAGDVIAEMYAAYVDSGQQVCSMKGMTAAYQVARAQVIDEALGPVTGDDQRAACDVYMGSDFVGIVGSEDYRAYHRKVAESVINNRRARLAQADKPRTPAERVTVERMGASEHVFVDLDGVPVYQFDGEDDAFKHAERYAAGLRAELEKAQ
jgi:hypothetical protein